MYSDTPTSPRNDAASRSTRRPNDFHVYHDPASDAKLSTTVAHALADLMGTDVTDTEFTLYNSIDPDALDRLFSPRSERDQSTAHVAFTVRGYQVTVYSSGHIVLTPPST